MICILAGIYNLPPSVVLLDIPLRAVQTLKLARLAKQFPARGFDENLIGECMRMSGMNLVAVQEYSSAVGRFMRAATSSQLQLTRGPAMDRDDSFEADFGDSFYEASPGSSSRSTTSNSSLSGRCLRRPVVVKSKRCPPSLFRSPAH